MLRDSNMYFFGSTDIKAGGRFGDAIDLVGFAGGGDTATYQDRDIAVGNFTNLYACLRVTVAGAGGTNATFQIETGDAFTTSAGLGALNRRIVIASPAVALASLTTNKLVVLPLPPDPDMYQDFLGVRVQKSGTFTALSAEAWLNFGPPAGYKYLDAQN